MKAALLGWLFFLTALIGGYMVGRQQRLRARSAPRRVEAAKRAPERTAVARSSGTLVSTGAAAELPSDYRRPESVPPVLK